MNRDTLSICTYIYLHIYIYLVYVTRTDMSPYCEHVLRSSRLGLKFSAEPSLLSGQWGRDLDDLGSCYPGPGFRV